MSNFTVNGVYQYTSANLYSYLGRVPSSDTTLKETFDEFGINATGSTGDLTKLKNAMFEEYSTQVQEQINNQNETKKTVPWAGLLAQIGIQATGNYEKDYTAFNNAIQLLSQSAYDGQAMAYFAGLRNEASRVFSVGNNIQTNNPEMSFYDFQSIYLT